MNGADGDDDNDNDGGEDVGPILDKLFSRRCAFSHAGPFKSFRLSLAQECQVSNESKSGSPNPLLLSFET